MVRVLLASALLPLLAAGCLDLSSKAPDDSAEARQRTPRAASSSRSSELSERGLEVRRSALLERINNARRREGEPSVARQAALERAAQRHAEDMVERRYFAHEDPDGRGPRERAEAAGYRSPRRVGEAPAWGDAVSAASTVEGWLGSAPHREILLDARYSEAGVGIAVRRSRGGDRLYWVALFAAPAAHR